MRSIFIITGVQASGKSTVARLLAESAALPRSVHVGGDVFRRMVVNGRAEMTAEPSPEAVAQLRLRHRLTATVADAYFEAGFGVVVQDVIIGPHLGEMVAAIRSRPLHVVVLAPSVATVAAREAARSKDAYGIWTIEALDRTLRTETPRLGLWLDTSELTPEETVAEILSKAADEARIYP
ncbi:AAA family ATPase [Spongiactinospora sp. 9N601]|uniref:AAA family ATPase n=1 Tax=Spongiactinospora sp. 9N601 TaxID=3375149 RepID=UPI0037A9B952